MKLIVFLLLFSFTAQAIIIDNMNSRWGLIQGNINNQGDLKGLLDQKALATDLQDHIDDTSNPHSVTKAQVGLGNADNTSDANKPVSTAQASAISTVQSDIDVHEADVSNPHSVTKSQVGLGNVDNTSDVNKPVSTAQQAALDLKVDKVPFVDLSVNNASIYFDANLKLNFYNYIRTNTAGNFNGGGVGNKMLCGLKGYNNGSTGIALTSMPTIEFEYTTKQPTTPTAAATPYIQGIADFDVQRIVSFDSALNGGGPTGSNAAFGDSSLCSYSLKRTLISGTTFKSEVDVSQHCMYIVVTGLATNVIPGAVQGTHYTVQAGAPAVNASNYWQFVTYNVAAVQALYPNAKFYDSIVTDGGAPKSKLMTGLYFGVGDSSTNTYYHHLVNYVKVNGTTIY